MIEPIVRENEIDPILPTGCLQRAVAELSQEASRSMSARPSAKIGEMQTKLTGEQQKPQQVIDKT
jgi:hypothetical protein